ncbi:Lsr2 family protein [Corynebacterium sp.]|uniref:histone-like nucleoid-structuring protein Lsr2 n=1 Tax=Corynebacterium sp. TaxID=1720 RepID=UPI0028A767A8|nr:Lsr2 family protein [Corynebacterium sp.]
MARREVTQFFDDLDNTSLTADEVNVVEFSYKGSTYVLDLSEENAQKFADTIEPYIAAGTKVTRTRGRGRPSSNAGKSDSGRNRRIREWARNNGLSVSSRGQIAREVIDAYESANPSDR